MKKLKIKFILLITFYYTLNIISQDLYDIKNITIVELSFENSNWNQIMDQYYAEGNGKRLLATATINGVKFDSVGVKYKGNSSYFRNDKKKPLNIKLDYILSQNYQGFEKLKLSNGKHDPSFIREVLSYEIARKYMVAPLSNYAKVYINGNYYGLFSSSEAINGDFGQRYLFAKGDNTRIKGNGKLKGPLGVSSLEYYGKDSTKYYSHYELKSDFGWIDLVELIDILNNNTVEIESILDVDKTLWMLAFNNVMVNLDSYSSRQANYYLIKDNNGIFNPILWDLNLSLGGFETIGGGLPKPGNLNELIHLNPLLEKDNPKYPLIQKLLENERYKKMYIAHCRTILNENLVNNYYEIRGLELQNIITQAYEEDLSKFYSTKSFKDNLRIRVPASGPPHGGSKPCFGIKELFSPRIDYLQSHKEFSYQPPVINSVEVIPAKVSAFNPFTINVKVNNSKNVLLAFRNGDDKEFEKIVMFDDGLHNDGNANDGIFGIEVIAQNTDIQYYIFAENDNAGVFEPKRAAFDFFEIEIINDTIDVVINEFLADNKSIVSDNNGEFDDWIELYNNTSNSISLNGWFLTDDENDLTKWSFPDISIEPRSYIVVWADKDEAQEGLHANFKLSKNGEEIVLSNSNKEIVDIIKYGVQHTDISFGRYPNGIGDFVEMSPTFNAENHHPNDVDIISKNVNKLIVYPNPANNWLKIEVKSDIIIPIVIYNNLGQNIWRGNIKNKLRINTSKWNKGIYYVKAGYKFIRFIKS